jgi:hypothetical protein
MICNYLFEQTKALAAARLAQRIVCPNPGSYARTALMTREQQRMK